jgi:tubulin polyglutamylase TTLL6/13
MCFEILGFDIMLDCKHKPYLLEVNHAPSFGTDSPLDEKIKGQVVYDTINLLGLSHKRKMNYKKSSKLKMDLRRLRTKRSTITQAVLH